MTPSTNAATSSRVKVLRVGWPPVGDTPRRRPEVAGELGEPLDISTRVVQGRPAQVLTHAATGAQLLVVGTRGHGTFAGMLLGSASLYCVQHSPCPVVVVPS